MLWLVLQDALDGSQEDSGVQLDASQLAEYRQLKADADDKTGRLLHDIAAIDAQLKVVNPCLRQILQILTQC